MCAMRITSASRTQTDKLPARDAAAALTCACCRAQYKPHNVKSYGMRAGGWLAIRSKCAARTHRVARTPPPSLCSLTSYSRASSIRWLTRYYLPRRVGSPRTCASRYRKMTRTPARKSSCARAPCTRVARAPPGPPQPPRRPAHARSVPTPSRVASADAQEAMHGPAEREAALEED